MRLSAAILFCWAVALAVLLGSCGGSSDGAPAPLAKRTPKADAHPKRFVGTWMLTIDGHRKAGGDAGKILVLPVFQPAKLFADGSTHRQTRWHVRGGVFCVELRDPNDAGKVMPVKARLSEPDGLGRMFGELENPEEIGFSAKCGWTVMLCPMDEKSLKAEED